MLFSLDSKTRHIFKFEISFHLNEHLNIDIIIERNRTNRMKVVPIELQDTAAAFLSSFLKHSLRR